MKKLSEVTHQFRCAGNNANRLSILLGVPSQRRRRTNEGDRTMSNVTKIALSAAIILSTAFSALAASNAGATREQAASSGTGMAAYDRYGGIVSSQWR
jgi:hypothetical protein